MKILVTGAAGFIGFHLTKRFLNEGYEVIGLDDLNSYYDPSLKVARLGELKRTAKKLQSRMSFFQEKMENLDELNNIFLENRPDYVVNLAAQAGVRYSLINPSAYIQSNLVGFSNILECCRKFKIKHLVYASSSSVYGGNTKTPFSEMDNVDHPVSIYAASKKSNELMAHTYSHLFGLPTTGLRFFTVYGPWGRPDMALFLFTKNILNGQSIEVFNNGDMVRDFTYIDDVVESVFRVIKLPAKKNIEFDSYKPNPATSWAPYQIFNIGNSNPIQLMSYIEALEKALKIKANLKMLPMQPGEVVSTYADTDALYQYIGFKPRTSIEDGISSFVAWYIEFYSV